MKRQAFLQKTFTTILATGLSLPVFSKDIAPRKAFKVSAFQTRYKEKIAIANAPIDFKLLSSDTENNLSVFISTNNQKGMGPPLHVHHDVDEFFCVLNGPFLFQVGDEVLSLDTGDCLFIPQDVRHCFTYNGDSSGSLLVGMLPGKGMEEYFAEMGKALSGPGMPDMKAMAAVYKKYNSEILGPPMK